MLDQITPLILTRDEAPNILRTLERLPWARDIVIVDSGSTDGTQDLAKGCSKVRVFERPFTTHAEQWQFGLERTGIRTEWVLALDADYIVTEDVIREIASLQPGDGIGGFRASFVYCISGKPLRSGVYPPVVVLYRRAVSRYVQDGHTQRVVVNGKVEELSGKILHDDRKPLQGWLAAQARYMRLEADKLSRMPTSKQQLADRVRSLILPAAPAMLFYCLFVRGGILDGRAGLFYAFQRTVAEAILSLYLLENRLRTGTR